MACFSKYCIISEIVREANPRPATNGIFIRHFGEIPPMREAPVQQEPDFRPRSRRLLLSEYAVLRVQARRLRREYELM
ncbi:hypothetical protein CAEBREN_18628 [Caenorhabditis brenneri]|uniref:Uncharacterized protein n=1 Tax=Caenorhabditis brenneri TaxID=135651 RepID=G0MW61_CAEBE|nr:hypothetical protein CAEBREN_18628 [Caenorhabditis brenneri]